MAVKGSTGGGLLGKGGGLLGPSGSGTGNATRGPGGGLLGKGFGTLGGGFGLLGKGGGLLGGGFGTLGLSERTRRFMRRALSDAVDYVQTFDQAAKDIGAAQGIKVSSTGTSDADLADIREQVAGLEVTGVNLKPQGTRLEKLKGVQQTAEAVDWDATVEPPPPPVDQQQATFLRLDPETGRPVVLAGGKELFTTFTIGSTGVAPGQSVLVTTINGQNVMETPEQAKKRMQKGPVSQEPGKKDRPPAPLAIVPWLQRQQLFGMFWLRYVALQGTIAGYNARHLAYQFFSGDGQQFEDVPLWTGGIGSQQITRTYGGAWTPEMGDAFSEPEGWDTTGGSASLRKNVVINYTDGVVTMFTFPLGGARSLVVMLVRSGSDRTEWETYEYFYRSELIYTESGAYQDFEQGKVPPDAVLYSFTRHPDRYYGFNVGYSDIREIEVPADVRTALSAASPDFADSSIIRTFPNEFASYSDPGYGGTVTFTTVMQRLTGSVAEFSAKIQNMGFPYPDDYTELWGMAGPGAYACYFGAPDVSEAAENPSYDTPEEIIADFLSDAPVPAYSIQIEPSGGLGSEFWDLPYTAWRGATGPQFEYIPPEDRQAGTNRALPFGAPAASADYVLTPPAGFSASSTSDEKATYLTWDWSRPDYCKAQALAMGFTEEDLAPP